MSRFERSGPRRRRFGRSVVPIVAAVAALGLAACEPPPPPDGRDLGVVIESPPTRVEKGAVVELAGTLTNHGTAPATSVVMNYGVTGGFTVDDLDLGGAATCAAGSDAQVTCTLDIPLAGGQSLPFTLRSTAGQVSGVHSHLLGAGSAGTEPSPDTNPGFVVFDIDVRPAPVAPAGVRPGNGTNYLGTGGLLGASGSGRASEGMHLAVNPYCTDKVNGDRFQSATNGGTCAGSVNVEYNPAGYTYVLDVPEGLTTSIDVLLWDARYNDQAVPAGDTTEPGVDQRRQSGAEPYNFTLYAADNSPLNPSDNPVMCAQMFTSDTPFNYGPYLGSVRWNKLCSITPSQPAGEYYLTVRNGGAVTTPEADGSNQFAVVAALASAGGDPVSSLCDRATRADCPEVFGRDGFSIQIGAATTVARIPLGQIDAGEEGRRLRIELFDPGEGMESILLLAPTGSSSWGPTAFTWYSPGVSGSGSIVTSLDVRNSRFNGRLVTIDVDLAGYQPPPGNDRWLVEYRSGGAPVTDRTTWAMGIVDHP